MNCENCKEHINESFCSTCGQTVNLKRIDKHYVSHELSHLFHFEKGFFYNVKELLTRPGISIKEFLTTSRTRHMKPIPFVIITALFYSVVLSVTHADKAVVNEIPSIISETSYVRLIIDWLMGHHGYGNLIEGVLIAFSIKIFYRKFQYNIFEILILLCFIIGQNTLLLGTLTLFFGLMDAKLYSYLLTIITLGYSSWALGDFFGGHKIGRYIKAFIVCYFGFILFILVVILLGFSLDLIMKH